MKFFNLHFNFSEAEHMQSSSLPPQDPLSSIFENMTPRLSKKMQNKTINIVNNTLIYNENLTINYVDLSISY